MKITDKAIREWLGHNRGVCRVRIARDGKVTRFGARDPIDRSQDFWAYMGTRDELAREIRREQSVRERRGA